MIFNFLNKKNNAKNQTQDHAQKQKDKLLSEMIKDPNHLWIAEDRVIKRVFIDLLNSLNNEHVNYFLKNKTYFIPCQAHLSCAIGKTGNHHLILVFPDLIKILKSASPEHAMAILAHEMGHVFYQHTEFKIETLKAQIEADDFAYQIGFGEELQDILMDYNESVDCRVRIAKLTSKLITAKYATR